jgi:hypothetical protein
MILQKETTAQSKIIIYTSRILSYQTNKTSWRVFTHVQTTPILKEPEEDIAAGMTASINTALIRVLMLSVIPATKFSTGSFNIGVICSIDRQHVQILTK